MIFKWVNKILIIHEVFSIIVGFSSHKLSINLTVVFSFNGVYISKSWFDHEYMRNLYTSVVVGKSGFNVKAV